MSELKRDELDEPYYEEEVYHKGLSREETIERQNRIVGDNYSNGRWASFEYSLKILIAFIPKELRETLEKLDHDVTDIGIERHYQQFVLIQKKLQDDTNMIFKKKFIKTFK